MHYLKHITLNILHITIACCSPVHFSVSVIKPQSDLFCQVSMYIVNNPSYLTKPIPSTISTSAKHFILVNKQQYD